MGSSFGELFRITTFGESHGGGVGVVVDGCPPRLPLNLEAIQAELDRRKPGQSKITTPRKEDDRVEILSGLLDGLTLGTPIAMLVRNRDQRPQDYRDHHSATDFQPGNIGNAWGWRVKAHTLKYIRAINACGCDLYQHLSLCGLRYWSICGL